MKKILSTFILLLAVCVSASADVDAADYFDNNAWGFGTVSDESGTAYILNGGMRAKAPRKVVLKASGNTDDAAIKAAIANYDIIVLDGANGPFVIDRQMAFSNVKHKTIVGINDAVLSTKFFLTSDDIEYLKKQGLEGLSSVTQIEGTLPDGTKLKCDERAFYTKKAMEELQYKKSGSYSLPNRAGIFEFGNCENIILRNVTMQGPGAVDIDGVDLVYNKYSTHLWVDHCTFVDSQDGALDTRGDYSTYTWNKFYYTERSYSHAYTCGLGWVENHSTVLHVTWGFNEWGKGCNRRLPQADDCYLHLVNNYHNCAGNSVGMTINSYATALVEGNYAAAGVSSPLTGSGSNRHILARENSFFYSSNDQTVTVPYEYKMISYKDVANVLEAPHGAGATLDNDMIEEMIKAPEQETTSILYYHYGDKNNKLTFGDGATLQCTNASKTLDPASDITLEDEVKYKSIKLSNGAQNVFTCPDGKVAVGVTFYSYINAESTSTRTSFWREVGGVTYTDEEGKPTPAATILESYKDGANPDVVSFSLNNVSSFTFTNSGDQLCVVMEVEYVDPTEVKCVKGIPTTVKAETVYYNVAGQRVSRNAKGLVISSAGAKFFNK